MTITILSECPDVKNYNGQVLIVTVVRVGVV